MAESNVPRIESSDLSLAVLFRDFYSVPDFQREYVWEPTDVERLLMDIVDEFEGSAGDKAEYFIGSIVCCRDDGGTFQLIDGQQRMTTIFLALCAIRDHLTTAGAQVSDSLRGFIRAASMDPETGNDRDRYRLSLQYADSRGVLDTIAAGSTDVQAISGGTASVRHVVAAYGTIREFLSERYAQPEDCRKFLAAMMSRVKLIRIVTPNLSHALKVFETINDRGVGLNAMDLLKNLLFMRTGEREFATLKDVWKRLIDALDHAGEKPLRFLRYFILANFEVDPARPLREDEIYDWLVKHSDECGISRQPVQFAERLLASAKDYGNFLSGNDQRGNPLNALLDIKALGGAVRQHLILLLAARHLPRARLERLAEEVERLMFCYFVTKEQTKNFERYFTKWAPALRAVNSDAELETFIKDRILADLGERLKQFDFAMAHMDEWTFQQYRLRYILAKLSQHVDSEAWGNPKPLSHYLDRSVHIEHVLPVKPTDEVKAAFDKPAEYGQWYRKLGNLTLLEKTINTSIVNGPFASKKSGYEQSTFLLTQTLAKRPQVGTDTAINRATADLPPFQTWNSESIVRRQGDLCRLARRVWLPTFANA